MIAYTVDRAARLTKGLVLDLKRYNDLEPQFLQTHVDELFPSGVFNHGDFYLLNSNHTGAATDPNLELLWEYVRRSSFPDRPSRYQAVFGCDSVHEAEAWRAQFGKQEDGIWRLEGAEGFRADMALLTQEDSILVLSYRAHCYWRGDTPGNPLWERLLVPPVTVLDRVKS